MIITVNELLFLCAEQKAKGNGNKEIYISADDEGNGFHPLFYGFTEKKDNIEAYEMLGCIDEVEGVIILG